MNRTQATIAKALHLICRVSSGVGLLRPGRAKSVFALRRVIPSSNG
ncbi:hypothetical protein RD1_3947 [Roseobacter denitrificans OCh 114]|uniref:Uncharacterized protein n=1 Tax=Roseobacter denitrificans (strain ATCC 33942 / OCh 114) TaxID=375451 RepID=Q161E1_ROSDO|nr:hypothetical protein RD1_3947 [Roseobacter denitrificans OCh 114]